MKWHLFKKIEDFYPWSKIEYPPDLLGSLRKYHVDDSCYFIVKYFPQEGFFLKCAFKIKSMVYWVNEDYVINVATYTLQGRIINKNENHYPPQIKDILEGLSLLIQNTLRPNSVSFILDLEKEVLDGKAHPN